MKNTAKLSLQLLGLAAWTTMWIGGGLLLLHKAIKSDEKEGYGKEER